MFANRFLSEWNKLQFQVKLQNISIVVLTVAILACVFIIYRQSNSKRTVITPSHINASIEVSDIDASPNFIRVNIVYALSLLHSYTPSSASNRFQELLISYIDSSKNKEMRSILMQRLNEIQALKVSESLEVEQMIFLPNKYVLVRGKIYRYTLGNPIGVEPVYIHVGYRLRDGNLKLHFVNAISHADYSRIQRQEEMEGKKIQELEKKRVRAREGQERKERQEEQKMRIQGKFPDAAQDDPSVHVDEAEPDTRPQSLGSGLEGGESQ